MSEFMTSNRFVRPASSNPALSSAGCHPFFTCISARRLLMPFWSPVSTQHKLCSIELQSEVRTFYSCTISLKRVGTFCKLKLVLSICFFQALVGYQHAGWPLYYVLNIQRTFLRRLCYFFIVSQSSYCKAIGSTSVLSHFFEKPFSLK